MIDKIPVYVTETALMPRRAHPNDAGLDLRAAESARIGPHDTLILGTGVYLAIPAGHMGIIALRSSMCKRGLAMPNGIGIIDADYRGELKVTLYNVDDVMSASVERGERIAQLAIVPIETPEIELVADKWQLGETERGEGGFGSTGTR